MTTLPTWNGCNDPSVVFATGSDGSGTARSIISDSAQAASGIIGAMTAASTFSLATGIGAAAIGLTALGFAIANIFSGCGETCTAATTYANAAEDKLNQILTAWDSVTPHPRSMQVAALTIIVGTFTALCKACGQSSLGSAGQRCISERLVAGAPAPWCPTNTGCDWVTTYYLPIANATDIVPDEQVNNVTPPIVNVAPPTVTQPGNQPSTNQPSTVSSTKDNSATYIVAAVVLLALIKFKRSK